ncbi:MAG: hypothetical protein IJI03_12340 [Rudaea sp.]|nr:hypothetical protein [Rudaea sp.]
MFKFAKNGNVYWPVNLLERDPNGGETKEQPVFLLLRLYSRTERKARATKLRDATTRLLSSTPGSAEMTAINLELEKMREDADNDVAQRVLGWRDVGGDDGAPLPFTPENLADLLDDEAQFARVAAALDEASRGARAKNSLPGAAG